MTDKYLLISVVVPIYKVEKYLRQCLDSLAAQTYPNVEVILMDDGSPDNCPQICDEYVSKNARFRVIHQPHSGLTTITRLNAIKEAQGSLLTFVDGDDWVEPDYLSYLYKLRTTHNADICVCAPYGMGSLYMFYKKPLVVNSVQALQIMCTDKFYAGYLWNKLYSKTYWQNLQLPPQNMFEDIYFNSQIFSKVSKIVFAPKRLYHYRIVRGSVSHRGFQENKLFFFTLTENMKRWAVDHQHMRTCCWITNTQLIAYLRNWIHYFRSNSKTKDLKTKLQKTCPSISFYFKLDKYFFYKWITLLWLLMDNLVADFYAVFLRKKEC